ncbi:phage tail protein [Escherichia coli]|nr:phage tail protein [Escherichia coli]
MSQTAITLAFEHWKAQQGATGEPVLLDEFVFANVPGLNPDTPVDRNEALPPVEQIVHRQPVTRTGVVNENGVVYSAVLGADVGDFSFNWIGLLNKASGTLAMIVHAPVQQKLKTAEGQQGNVLTRSFLMEYNGAQTETGITTPAETWQIDFTARMAGMDERQRLENTDIYGAAAFFGDGWLVGKTGNQFFVTKGTGYVAGLRTSLAANQNITVTTKPVKVWLDVCWTGSLTSVWNAQCKITVAENLADYVQNGVQHYVFAVASIDVNGNITDLRPKGTLNEQQASDALKKHEQSRNHPDATTSTKGFTQLSSATDSTSEEQAATSKAVKIAMDNANARLAKERNGADIPNPPLFVQNLGLAETIKLAAGAVPSTRKVNEKALTGDIYITSQDIFDGQAIGINPGQNLNDLKKAGLYFQWMNVNTSSTLNYPENNAGALIVLKSAGITQIYYVYNSSRIWSRSQYSNEEWTPWAREYNTQNKPSAADVGALPITGGTLTGPLGIGVANGNGLGGNSIVLGDSDTGFKQEGDGILNVYANSALVMRFISSIVESLKPLKVNGNCIATGEIQAGNGAVRLAADGNVYGTMWGGWLMNYLTNTFQLKGNYVQDIRQSGIMNLNVGSHANTQAPAGGVVIGAIVNGDWDNNEILKYTWLQKNVNGTWLTIGRV